jgi:hypothetical protein
MARVQTIMTTDQYEKLAATPRAKRPAKARAFKMVYGNFYSHKVSRKGHNIMYRIGETVRNPDGVDRGRYRECSFGLNIASLQWLALHPRANILSSHATTLMLMVEFDPRKAVFPVYSGGKFRVAKLRVLGLVSKGTGKLKR